MSADRLGQEVLRRSAEVVGPVSLEREVAEAIHQVVPYDAWCALTIDPATLLPTGGFHEYGVAQSLMPRLAEIESANLDALSFPALTRASSRAMTLAEATEGRLERSVRYREVIKPSGLQHEVRLLFPADGRLWGCLILFRADGAPDFSRDELEVLVRGTEAVGAAVRRQMVLTEIAHDVTTSGPGLVLLDDDLVRLHATPAALHWLADVEDGIDPRHELPMAVTSVAGRVLSGSHDGSATSRLRTRSGHWLTLHADLVTGDRRGVSVIVEPSRPVEVAQIVADAYQLTQREREVVHCLATGHSRAEVARALAVSSHTVDDHIKRVYGKLGVRSRAELTTRLFFDQHFPRITEEVPVGGTGWFLK